MGNKKHNKNIVSKAISQDLNLTNNLTEVHLSRTNSNL